MANWFRRSPRTSSSKHGRVSYRPAVEGLEDRCLLAAPMIDPITNVVANIPVGKTLFIPVSTSDADGNPISYTVQSSNSDITAEVRTSDKITYLKLTVTSAAPNNINGELVFQLFGDLTPETVKQITDLVNKDFYDGLTFHRVVPNFVIQGGDPNGDGSGGPGFTFDDEFNPNTIFSGNGQLAMANSGKDTNGSQFFVTVGPQRALDFNHTIFGQLVRGFDVLTVINNVPTGTNNRPTTPVVITKAEIVPDTTDAVLILRATKTGQATISVIADDGTGETDTEFFTATAVTDTTNDPPILGPVSNVTTAADTPAFIPLTGIDLENNALVFQAVQLDSPVNATVQVIGSTVVVVPNTGFSGDIHLRVGVAQQGATSRGTTPNPFDTQEITVTVLPFSGNEQQGLVRKIFLDILGRAPGAKELTHFTNELKNGVSPGQLALQLQTSLEGRNVQVKGMYQALLNRSADTQGLRLSVAFLLQGGNIDALRPILLGSPEFFTEVGDNTTNGFLDALFTETLGRELDETSRDKFAELVSDDDSRRALAAGVLRGLEAQQFLAAQLYQQFLERGASATELMFIGSAAVNGVSDEALAAGFVSSPEYLGDV